MTNANLLITNGRILTMNPDMSTAEAIAVGRDGRIVAIGRQSDVQNLADAETHTINLNGRTLLPGFFDCHLHILWLGINLGHVNLASPPVKNADDIIALLRQRRTEQPNLTCLQGNRYDQNKLPGGTHITRHDLDKVASDIPARVVHTSGHAAVVNSRALELLGITKETANPVGGEIVRDANGEPNGVLLETASWQDLDKILPEVTQSDAITALGQANGYLLERGITSATDANTMPADIPAYGLASAQNGLTVRTNLMVSWAEIVKQAGQTLPRPQDFSLSAYATNGHRLHVGQAKLFSDGAITTRTCWLSEPFAGMPDNRGIPIHEAEELRDLIVKAHTTGWQIATHAIGDKAIDTVLACYAEAQRVHSRYRPDHRIEHAMLLNPNLITRMRRQNIWSVGQPEFISGLGDAYFDALGEERAFRLSPYATLDAQNVAQAFSSDCPVVPGAPLDGIRAAIERKTPKGRILNPLECVSPETAVYNYTAAPAYATRTEQDRGTLEIGKWADFVLLSADPISTPADEWERLQVEATFVGGECLYGAEQLD